MAGALIAAMSSLEELKAERGVSTPSLLNLILTDGKSTVATRYIIPGCEEPHSLYLHKGVAYECVDGVCRMRNRSDTGNTVLIASEPLSQDEGWTPVAANTMLVIDKESRVEARPITLHSSVSRLN